MSKDKERYTTYVDKDQLERLEELSEATRESSNRLFGQALDDFLKKLGLIEERKYVPLDMDYMKRKYEEYKKVDTK